MMDLRSRLRRPALLLALILLTGCASLGLVEPDVTLVNLKFTDLTVFETSGIFIVRLANENPEPLVVEGGVYNLYLGGFRIGKGLSDHHIEVPALGTAIDEVELHMSNLAIATQLRSILDSGIVDYRIKAKVYVDRGYGRRKVTVEHEGRFDFNSQEVPDDGRLDVTPDEESTSEQESPNAAS
ncbi:MAG: LEA type 2 family protein [bacterium]|nr:LEA type 2 family protein [bacterium]